MQNLRFAKNKLVSSENYVTVMIRLHLAHGNTYLYDRIYHIINVHMNVWFLKTTHCRTLPLDRHKDEGKPTVLGRDDPDDHLFVILILRILILTIKSVTIFNIKTIHQNPPQSTWRVSKGSQWTNKPRWNLCDAQNYDDGHTRWSSRYTTADGWIISRLWNILKEYLKWILSVHTVQTRLV